jgi:hypothetical protein
MRNGRYIFLVGVLLTALIAANALAAGGYKAHANRPSFDSATLELLGNGTYRSDSKRKQLRITVCLRKRVGGRSFDVRCSPTNTAEKARKVTAQVSVPGCVRGVWRTRVVGEAFDRNGNLLDQSTAVSRPFRC